MASSAAQQLEESAPAQGRALLDNDRITSVDAAKRIFRIQKWRAATARAARRRAAAAKRAAEAAAAAAGTAGKTRSGAAKITTVSLPNQVVCKAGDPGTRCVEDPCIGATCAAYPAARCIPNYCRRPTTFLGITTGKACTPTFVNPVTGLGVNCD